jgi:betaine-aldehyde dehydrogenase
VRTGMLGKKSLIRREPIGVVAAIVPWNVPQGISFLKLGPALAAGNTVVLKPSEHTSLSALRLGELASTVLPAGVLNVVTGTGDGAGDRLVTHPEVRRIGFTGGVAAGRRVLQRAAESGVKTVTLELGGKNPLIVFPDADLAAAVAGAVRGMNFTWQGQSCGSTSRCFVHRSVVAEFLDGLAAAVGRLALGDPLDEATDVGALASRPHFERVCRYLDRGLADPECRLVAGGRPERTPVPGGFYLLPTVFALPARPTTPLAREEIFGPVLVVMPFDDEAEVVGAANDVGYGLTASIWTRDLGTAMRVARAVEAGYIWVNSSSTHVPGAPFGGVKDSGVGREEGIEELLSYTEAKNVYIRYGSGASA